MLQAVKIPVIRHLRSALRLLSAKKQFFFATVIKSLLLRECCLNNYKLAKKRVWSGPTLYVRSHTEVCDVNFI